MARWRCDGRKRVITVQCSNEERRQGMIVRSLVVMRCIEYNSM